MSLFKPAGAGATNSPAAGWYIRFLAPTICVATAFCWANYKVNLFGLFGDARGLSRPVYLDEAQTKYLLSMNYVPSNFDGLLIGSSITDDWDTGRVRNVRMYNASIEGANISEEKLIADNILDRGRLRVVLLTEWPYMTASHGRLEGGMEPRLYWEGLGSLRLLYSYKEWLRVRTRRGHLRNDVNGVGLLDYDETPGLNEWRAHPKAFKTEQFSIDPVAFAEYRDVMRRAQQSGALVVRLIPPVYYDRWLASQASYTEYFRKVNELFPASGPLIDCNTTELSDFRKKRENFLDGIHLSGDASSWLMQSYVTTELQRILARSAL
jgi:hypothetical protein